MRLAKYKKIGNWTLIAVLLSVCLYAFHDMQTAEGVGLYFSMLMGIEQRIYLDVAVDVICILALSILIYVPCRVLGQRTTEAYLRLLIGYLAAMPQLSLAKVIALFRPGQQEFLWDMGFMTALYTWIYSLAPFLQVWIPLLVLLYGFGVTRQCFVFRRWYQWIGVCLGILLVILLMIPTAENVLLYLMGYLGLLVAFDCWEAVLAKIPEIKRWSVWLWGILLLRGIYRIWVLMSQF